MRERKMRGVLAVVEGEPIIKEQLVKKKGKLASNPLFALSKNTDTSYLNPLVNVKIAVPKKERKSESAPKKVRKKVRLAPAKKEEPKKASPKAKFLGIKLIEGEKKVCPFLSFSEMYSQYYCKNPRARHKGFLGDKGKMSVKCTKCHAPGKG